MKTPKELFKEFNAFDNDLDKWIWLRHHQGYNITTICDNDETFITIDGFEDTAKFFNHIGNTPGLFDLLESVHVNAESV